MYFAETTSILTYKPGSDLGYGQFSCRAHNEAGETKKPCVYQVIPPGTKMINHN